MHDVYQVHSLLRINNVECLAANNDTLLVGTKQGFLFMYKLEKNDLKCEVTLLRFDKQFSSKPIQQLEIIPDQNLLLCLTDNIIKLHDISVDNFSTLTTIERSKGATCFAVSTQKIISATGIITHLIRLAVVVKKKLQLYFLKKSDFIPLLGDIDLIDIPKCMVLCQNALCLGYKDRYSLLQLGDGKETELFPTSDGKPAEPCMELASESHFAVCRRKHIVVVNISGETETNMNFTWSEVPLCLAYDEPYTLGILTDSIEVCSLERSMSVQTLTKMPKVRFLVQASSGTLFAASLSNVWCIQAVDITIQRDMWVNAKEFQLALKLTKISNESEEEKQEKIAHIQTLLAYDLFAKKQFNESVVEFLKLDIEPYDVIRLFPDMLPQTHQEESSNQNRDWTDRDIQNSILALVDYLTEIRHRLHDTKSTASDTKSKIKRKSIHQHDQLLQIIDTTLVKCYLHTNDALVAPLLRLQYCHLEETERVLKKFGKRNELVLLYKTKGHHEKALEILQADAEIGKTVEYLQNLGPDYIDLIIEYSNWVLITEPEEGLKIFTEDIIEVETLPRHRVLDTLMKSHSELVIPYLEHIIDTWNERDPFFHDTLIHRYREKILNNAFTAEGTREKLLKFLEESIRYTAKEILPSFPTDSLIEERALIVGRLGRHDEAMALFVRAVGNVEKAEKYCEKVYNDGGPDAEYVYVALIKILLKPDSFLLDLPGLNLSPGTAQPDLELALKLLEKNASKINPVEVLSTLPENIPVLRIHHFLTVAMHKVLKNSRQAEISNRLLYGEHLQCQDMKFRLQNQRVVVTEVSVCPICKKRFGNQSALVRYSNGDVVHYACHERRNPVLYQGSR